MHSPGNGAGRDHRRPLRQRDPHKTTSRTSNNLNRDADQNAEVVSCNFTTFVDECASGVANLANDLTQVAVRLDSRAWAAAALHVLDAAILIHQAIASTAEGGAQ